MATKTLILRPVKAVEPNDLDAVGWYPSDTPVDQQHCLINETVADDEATYFVLTTQMSLAHIFFTPDLNISPIAARVIFRSMCADSSTIIKAYVNYYDENNENQNLLLDEVRQPSSEWTTYSLEISSDIVLSIWRTLGNGYVQFSSGSETQAGKSSINIKITQVYLEVDYDDGTGADPVMYRKVSNAWEPVYGTVYNKVDGAWVEGTLDGLADGNSVTVVEV